MSFAGRHPILNRVPSVLRVFTGPPGTGKTYRAVREAISLIDGVVPADDASVRERFRVLVASDRLVPVTFHPSYSYEDLVEGYRPSSDEDGNLGYRIVEGPFLRAVKLARGGSDGRRGAGLDAYFRAGEVLRAPNGPPYTVLEVTPGGVVLETSVVRHDAVTDRSIRFVDFWTIEHLRAHGVPPEDLTPSGQQNERRQEVARQTLLPTTFLTNAGHYRAVYVHIIASGGPTAGDPPQATPIPVVLFIDEINRADLSRVFGELITLLESDKREGQPEERSVLLPYSQSHLTLPPSLHVIATMNTADRSLSVFDYALRRRFEFMHLEPDHALCPHSYGGIDVADFLARTNMSVGPLLGRNLLIGHAELMTPKLEEVRIRGEFADDDDGRARAVARALTSQLVPFLLECFTEDWRRVEQVLGSRGILRSAAVPGREEDNGDEMLDVADRSFLLAEWFDPGHPDFDSTRVRTALNPRVPGSART